MRAKKTPVPVELESETQSSIVAALELAGFRVKQTNQKKQLGPRAFEKGIPDLLVHHPVFGPMYVGIEVKRPGKIHYTSVEQAESVGRGEYVVCQSRYQALLHLVKVLESLPASDRQAQTLSKTRAVADQFKPKEAP